MTPQTYSGLDLFNTMTWTGMDPGQLLDRAITH